jgi:hypothetical protein
MRMTLIRRKPLLALVIFLQSVIFLPAASAQMEAPRALEQPVPDKWRTSYAKFLADLGVTDAGTIIGETKFGTIGRDNEPDTGVFRIEDKSNCFGDLCLTIVGHLDGDRFAGDALFFAGPKMNQYDRSHPLFGVGDYPYAFWSEHSEVLLFHLQQKWIVIPSSN